MSEKPNHSTDFGPDEAKRRTVSAALISWYDENARDLPWRRTRDPWRVLISEVMLQQIQVKRASLSTIVSRTVPTPRALADAPVAEAIRAWGDLGRYKRVVNLHRTARILVEEFGGEIPPTPKCW
jgi:A/G-specific adenine glycosylase